MFAALAPYKLLAECLAFFALIAAIAIGIHRFLSYEQDIGYQKAVAEYNQKLIAAQDAARATEFRLNKQLEDAQNAATKREQALSDAATASAAASGSLRNTVRNLSGLLPNATADAARKTAIAISGVFLDCQDKYRDMAKIADGHASDVRTLKDAWPK